MGTADRPEIVDAEFEVVSAAPARQPILLFYTLPQALLATAIVVSWFVYLVACLNAASDQANLTCQAIEQARARDASLPRYQFCVNRLANLAGQGR